MINDLKNKVNKEVLLRNVEIVEQAISTYFTSKSTFVSEINSDELEKFAYYLESRTIALPIGFTLFPCVSYIDIDFLKDRPTKDSKVNAYKQYLIDQYKYFYRNYERFINQDFTRFKDDKIFIEKIKSGLEQYHYRMYEENRFKTRDFDFDFYKKIEGIYNELQAPDSYDYWCRDKYLNSSDDSYAYWRHDNLPSDYSRSALSDLQLLNDERERCLNFFNSK